MSGLRNQKIYTQSTEEQIAHLAEEDRTAVMAVASQIVMADEHEKMHPKVATCYKKAKAGDSMDVVNFIAKESLPRAIKILDTLVKAAIPLGVEVDDKLQFSIGKDKVYLRFSETTKEVPHQLTKQEKLALVTFLTSSPVFILSYFVDYTEFSEVSSIPVTATTKLSWINCSKPIRSPMNPTRRISGRISENWMTFWDICRWKIIMPYSTSAVVSAQPMSIKLFWMVCSMADN